MSKKSQPGFVPVPPHEFAELPVHEKMKLIRVIAEIHPDTLILNINGAIRSIISSPYYLLKYKVNYGGQIEHQFTPDGRNYVKETFSTGIYNCWLNGKVTQVEDPPKNSMKKEDNDFVPGISRAILENDFEMYRSVVNKCRSAKAQTKMIRIMFSEYLKQAPDGGNPRLYIRDDKEYVIDDRFMVDSQGTAHVAEQNHTGGMKKRRWRHLCLVSPTSIKERDIQTKDMDVVTLNVVTQLIMAKMFFCLNPHADIVFLNQLPEDIRQAVEDDIKNASAGKRA